MEPAATNPFLEPFYQDPQRYAFPVQMFYLMTRWRQQQAIRQEDLFQSLLVSDYLFDKDRLFAEKTLHGQELELYDEFAEALGHAVPAPDLVVHLTAPTPVLMKRIARRRAPGEELIAQEYLVDLAERYDRLFRGWDRCPVLRLDNRDMNYVDDVADKVAVLDLIRSALEHPENIAPGSDPDREAQPTLF